MESKNIKIIDEHGIDRIANVVCSIDVDGSDYVIYWIERDNDNDNVFVSKLIKNNDGTSTMINIEDPMEKSNLNEIIKELVTHAINDDNDSLTTNNVQLKNGKNIKVSGVLFNKEQNINVQKTYITTVKKSVTKVSETYYRVQPVVDTKVEEVVETLPPLPEEVNEVPTVSEVSEIPPVVAVSETPVAEIPAVPEVPVTEPAPVPTIPEVSVQTPQPVPTPVLEVPNPETDARMKIVEPAPVTDNVSPQPVVPESSSSAPMPFESVQPKVASTPSEIFFDGSKETNLTDAFGGNATPNTNLNVNTVEPIREFGQDEPVIPTVNDVQPDVASNKSAGFANNKFFMVIAITFFIASCVFLDYEVFRYFQLK